MISTWGPLPGKNRGCRGTGGGESRSNTPMPKTDAAGTVKAFDLASCFVLW